jgi:hypothetical protein
LSTIWRNTMNLAEKRIKYGEKENERLNCFNQFA